MLTCKDLTAGLTVRLPLTEVRGGWGPGWYDFYPWRVESFTPDRQTATVRSLACRTVTTISVRQLNHFLEHAPFGDTRRSRPVRYEHPWYRKPIKHRRYA